MAKETSQNEIKALSDEVLEYTLHKTTFSKRKYFDVPHNLIQALNRESVCYTVLLYIKFWTYKKNLLLKCIIAQCQSRSFI